MFLDTVDTWVFWLIAISIEVVFLTAIYRRVRRVENYILDVAENMPEVIVDSVAERLFGGVWGLVLRGVNAMAARQAQASKDAPKAPPKAPAKAPAQTETTESVATVE